MAYLLLLNVVMLDNKTLSERVVRAKLKPNTFSWEDMIIYGFLRISIFYKTLTLIRGGARGSTGQLQNILKGK